MAGIAALGGLLLSFLVRRRRVFVRTRAAEGGQTLVEAGGLARADPGGGFGDEFAGLAAALRAALEDRSAQGETAAPPRLTQISHLSTVTRGSEARARSRQHGLAHLRSGFLQTWATAGRRGRRTASS